MVLSKVQEICSSHNNSSRTTTHSTLQTFSPDMVVVLEFIRQFKILQCSCCDRLMGFQDRITGALICTPGDCIKKFRTSNIHKGSSSHFHTVDAALRSNHTSLDKTFCGKDRKQGGYSKVPIKKIGKQNRSVRKRKFQHFSPTVGKNNIIEACSSVDTAASSIKERSLTQEPIVKNKILETSSTSVQHLKEHLNESLVANNVCKKMISAEEIRIPTVFNPFSKMTPPSMKAVILAQKVANVKNCDNLKFKSASSLSSKGAVTRRTEISTQTILEKIPVPLWQKPRPKQEQGPKYFWMSCHFSPNLVNGTDVKVTFIYKLNKYQIFAAIDEPSMMKFQNSIQDFVKKQKPMSRKPVKDEIVLALYDGQNYCRARVLQIKETGCIIIFVDFGGFVFKEFKYLIEPNDEIMMSPIWSVMIKLIGVPEEKQLLNLNTLDKRLWKYIFGPLQIELKDEFGYNATLWVSSEKTLNKIILKNMLKKNLIRFSLL